MNNDVESPFTPAAILRASGICFRATATKHLDRAQHGDRPSDFGDHKPIPDEARIQLSLGPKDLSTAKVVIEPPISEEKE